MMIRGVTYKMCVECASDGPGYAHWDLEKSLGGGLDGDRV
jgi:hypothetical protein